ncbi:hypothetical protein [Streptomyces sp. NPDC006368]|uniref:hypothetical protein n=1 Tax=Streptomyces sp. NPDC006368 TaxID=3156760 RepID=UPI0033A65E52
MGDRNSRVAGRRVTAVLAMGGGLMLGQAFPAHATSDGLGLSARSAAADRLAEPVSAAVDTAGELPALDAQAHPSAGGR